MAKEERPLIQPIESAKTSKEPGIPCWNCDGELDKHEVCPKCGFDRKLVYNLELEAEKTKEREQQ